MQVTFGKKIPIMNTHIYDKQSQHLVDAVVYELDCDSEEDYYHVLLDTNDNVPFKKDIADDVFLKYNKNLKDEPDKNSPLNYKKIYTLETKDGQIQGLLEALKVNNFANIEWLGAKQNSKYALLGQALSASLMKQMIVENNPVITVLDPSNKGRDFYINTCGFKPQKNKNHKEQRQVEIHSEGMFRFLKKYENLFKPQNNEHKSISIDTVA